MQGPLRSLLALDDRWVFHSLSLQFQSPLRVACKNEQIYFAALIPDGFPSAMLLDRAILLDRCFYISPLITITCSCCLIIFNQGMRLYLFQLCNFKAEIHGTAYVSRLQLFCPKIDPPCPLHGAMRGISGYQLIGFSQQGPLRSLLALEDRWVIHSLSLQFQSPLRDACKNDKIYFAPLYTIWLRQCHATR